MEQMLVVGGLVEDVSAQGVALFPVVEVVEALQPLGEAGGLAVGAGPRDRVRDVAGGDGGGEDVEGSLFSELIPFLPIVSFYDSGRRIPSWGTARTPNPSSTWGAW